jgi:hypothetical protein
MRGAPGVVDAVALAQGVQAVWRHGMLLAGKGQGIDNPVRSQCSPAQPGKLGIEKAKVELSVMDDQLVGEDKVLQLLAMAEKHG